MNLKDLQYSMHSMFFDTSVVFPVPIHFHCGGKQGKQEVLQNNSFCVSLKKQSHMGLERHEGEQMKNFNFGVYSPFKTTVTNHS